MKSKAKNRKLTWNRLYSKSSFFAKNRGPRGAAPCVVLKPSNNQKAYGQSIRFHKSRIEFISPLRSDTICRRSSTKRYKHFSVRRNRSFSHSSRFLLLRQQTNPFLAPSRRMLFIESQVTTNRVPGTRPAIPLWARISEAVRKALTFKARNDSQSISASRSNLFCRSCLSLALLLTLFLRFTMIFKASYASFKTFLPAGQQAPLIHKVV